ncbi:putative bifunctional diguanylate cyclase/phosphodiesterase [Actinoplanes utahensis]|uniref:Diguanylate phosphodiesterase n=1 Tax=Actinoplanes utahensis TaxID=1869 RepID=A0A0A6UNF7_ACTUT|nr:EAL domain-containing protein [Actinoplanes utahensis]KHD75829.1 hypothetical protein MB27_20540 [Actinoplanes utahensis]GIF32229.1 GGDEF domain-containing protein [Actinoplanes utahensis]
MSARDAAVARFVRQWVRAVRQAGFQPLSAAELKTMLSGHTHRLLAALAGGTDDPGVGTDIGESLVRAGLTDPGAVRACLVTFGAPLRTLLAVLDADRDRVADRVTAVQADLAAGYAAALRGRTLVEQERIGQAVLRAHKETEQALWESEARFGALFRDAAIGIGIADVDGRIVRVNPALARLLGYTEDEVRALTVRDLVHRTDVPDMWVRYDEMVSGARDYVRMEKAYPRKDGSEVWTTVTVSLLRDDTGAPRYTVAMMEDVTERHRLQERLRYEATHDLLTGLPNRACFTERLTAAFQEPDNRVGLCYLDLDGFKRINDSLGHDVGDRLLVAIAGRLRRCAGESGHLVARMGGDEFVVLATGASQDDLIAVADRVLASLEHPVQAGTHQFRVSASIGIVTQQARDSGPAEILRAADLTLYRAKAAGRGRWLCYDAELNAVQVARYTLAEELPTALHRGEFGLLYQPLVEVGSGRLLGVEALLRWHHPRLGTLSPDVFIDLAEESGAIGPIGRWVLGEACARAAAWRRRFPSFVVSVNLATAQTYDPRLVGDVLTVLADTGLPPGSLQLELTESAMMAGSGAPMEALRTLAGHDIRIAIDDFGTGYSNLVYLRTLPVRVLKLARQFVDGLKDGGSPADAHIVATLIDLAHVLDLSVIAEGVETPEQLARLRELDCDAAQGWHLGRPVTAAAIDDLLTRDVRV